MDTPPDVPAGSTSTADRTARLEPGGTGKPRTGAGDGLSIRPQTLRLTPQYRRLRDAILRPHLRLTESRYFWERWKPRLGADAAILIMEVRDRCNRTLALTPTSAPYHPADVPGRRGELGQPAGPFTPFTAQVTGPGTTGETAADGCTISASELAAACGFSRVTLWRLLQREDVRRFIRVEHNYVYDRRLGKKRRTVSTYHVLMEDPLVDEDEARLQQWLGTASGDLAAEVAAPPTVQVETLAVENSPPTLQLETNSSGSNAKPQNVLETILRKRLGTNDETAAPHGQSVDYPMAQPSPQPLPPPASQNAVEPPRRRGDTTQPRRSLPEIDMWRKYPELAHHVEEAEAVLGDLHSRGFYLKALKSLYPVHMGLWQRALGLAREQANIRRSRGALFTRLLRTFAAEAGVVL